MGERLHAVVGVTIDVTLGLNEHPAPSAGEAAGRQVVRQRSRGNEDRLLLAEFFREPRFQLPDGSARQVLVILRLLRPRQLPE